MASKLLLISLYTSLASGAGFRTVGSSGCTPQMVFLPPFTNTAVFIDNYHDNYGGPGYDVTTGTHSSTPYRYPGTTIPVFGTEFNLATNTIRPLKPLSNTFCSAGAFFPNGTLVNMAGAEPATGVTQGFDKLRYYVPGPNTGASGAGTQDWTERGALQEYRWYPSSLTTVAGDVLVVGGSNVGGLVLNEASINVPSYERVYADGRKPPRPVVLPILQFTAAQNLVPGKSYNLYPTLIGMPNAAGTDQIFTIAGNQTIIWDYSTNLLLKTLPDTPAAPRTFPSSATILLLPLKGPDYEPTVLVCGGCTGDMPAPRALADCYTIKPLNAAPEWITEESMPNGAQVLSDGLLLPDGTVLIINGARTGSGGGIQADDPAYAPLIYNPSAPAGSRFTSQPPSTIPRLYHSVASILPSGEVLVAGSNPVVGYSRAGGVPGGWPYFNNNGHRCALQQQQRKTSFYPTEYRVEIFSPPYMSATTRPAFATTPASITYGGNFSITTTTRVRGAVSFQLLAPGFHTHGVALGQRMVELKGVAVANTNQWNLIAPPNATVIAPGAYLLWIVAAGIPSPGQWVKIA